LSAGVIHVEHPTEQVIMVTLSGDAGAWTFGILYDRTPDTVNSRADGRRLPTVSVSSGHTSDVSDRPIPPLAG
jgi:hypothetical protein